MPLAAATTQSSVICLTQSGNGHGSNVARFPNHVNHGQ